MAGPTCAPSASNGTSGWSSISVSWHASYEHRMLDASVVWRSRIGPCGRRGTEGGAANDQFDLRSCWIVGIQADSLLTRRGELLGIDRDDQLARLARVNQRK